MADYTILANSVKENRSDVIIEFPVPAGNNTAGIAWRSVVAELRAVEQASPDSVVTSNPRRVSDAAYVGLLDAGSVMEIPLSVGYDANLNNAGKLAVLDAAVTAKVSEFTAGFGSTYRFYGTTRTV